MVNVYNINYINQLINNNEYKLNNNIKEKLDIIYNIVNSPLYNKSPVFINKNIIPSRKKVSKDYVQTNIDNIRKYLNKLTSKNYDIISIEIEKIMDIIYNNKETLDKETLDKETLDKLYVEAPILIFDIIFNSNFNINMYTKLYINYLSKYNCIKELFNTYYNNLINLYSDIQICNTINFDEVDKCNKNNEKLKSIILFIINYNINNNAGIDYLLECILKYQEVLFTNISIEYKKIFCEELTEILLFFIKNIYSLNSNNNINDNINNITIINNIIKLTTLNIKDYKSLSYKIIIKHKNLLDIIKN